MHLNTFYANLFNQTKRDEVFVIMSFDAAFQQRWERVIEPCIREELKLTPVRVDYRESGESIVHDILDGIAHAKLVLADITSVPMKDANGTEWPQRNGIVMWELGIAHTMRMPDEVIVVRSDDEKSLFDLTQFRAFYINPLREIQAKNTIRDLAVDRLRSVAQSGTRYVEQCVDALDYPCWSVLTRSVQNEGMDAPVIRTMGDVLSGVSLLPAIRRLLEMGALKTSYIKITPEFIIDPASETMPEERTMRYVPTPLAEAILRHAGSRMFDLSPELISAMEDLNQKLEAKKSETPSVNPT